jgi:hypothetical protein
VFIVSGRLYDAAFNIWLEAGHYASPPTRQGTGAVPDLHGLCRAGNFIPQSTANVTGPKDQQFIDRPMSFRPIDNSQSHGF